MSKSLGNFFTVRQILERFPGEAIRYAFLSTHYRQPLDWTEESIQCAKHSLDRLYQALRSISAEALASQESELLPKAFLKPLLDDLNTPLALSVLHELASTINKTSSASEKAKYASSLKNAANFLGLLESPPDVWFQTYSSAPPGTAYLNEEEIQALIDARKKARHEKQFVEADRIRCALLEKGIALEDTGTETVWRRI